MKTIYYLVKKARIYFIVVFLITASCKEKQTYEDTKIISEIKPEATFVSTINNDEAQYLVNAAEFNLEEILLGQLAERRSKNNSAKNLGKMMFEFHKLGLKNVDALASKKSIIIPSFSTLHAKEKYEKLNALKSSKAFDKTYCNMMITEHREAINMFDKIYSESNDPDIKKWAFLTLTDLRAHLDQALDCQAELNK